MTEDIGEAGPRLGLAESISSLRVELAEAITAAANEDLQFEVGEIELQLSLVAERSRQGSAGVKFWVVNADGRLGSAETTSHMVKIPLTPRRRGGGPTLTQRE